MTSTLARYLARLFIGHLLLIMISAVALLQLFDLMSTADDLLQDMEGQSNVLLHYTLLRLPDIVTFITPFSVLLAALMTFGRLHRHSELVALQAIGWPFPVIVIMLLPTLAIVAFLHFVVSDQLAPRTNRALTDWLAASETREPGDVALWLRSDDDLVSIGAIEDDGRRLQDVVIFERNDSGNLTAQMRADHALFHDDGWSLHWITGLEVEPEASVPEQTIISEPWKTSLQPSLVKDLAAPPNTLSIAKLRRVLDHPEVGSRPMHVYETWLHKSFATPLASLFMVSLAAASVRGLQRQGGVILNALVGFGGAFIYFVADGMLQAFGEAGSVSPALASWLPLVILATVSGLVLYWVVIPQGRRRAAAMPSADDGGGQAAAS